MALIEELIEGTEITVPVLGNRALPVIERAPELDNLVYATGFSGHGFCLGPVTGEILADLATEGATSHPIGSFARSRFETDTAAEAVALHG